MDQESISVYEVS